MDVNLNLPCSRLLSTVLAKMAEVSLAVAQERELHEPEDRNDQRPEFPRMSNTGSESSYNPVAAFLDQTASKDDGVLLALCSHFTSYRSASARMMRMMRMMVMMMMMMMMRMMTLKTAPLPASGLCVSRTGRRCVCHHCSHAHVPEDREGPGAGPARRGPLVPILVQHAWRVPALQPLDRAA